MPLSCFHLPDLLGDENIDGAPSEPGAHPLCIHLCSLLSMPLKHSIMEIISWNWVSLLKKEEKHVHLPGVD